MEDSVEDIGPPDSWESADLDESMNRLLVSSKKSSDSFHPMSLPLQEFGDETEMPYVSPASATTTGSGELCGVLSEDALNQVDQFLREALEKPRERLAILRMEQDIIKFIRDPTQQQLEFQDLPTSYLRLAAHRVAQHYYLQSVAMPDSVMLDSSGSQIVIHKTSYCRFPPVRLADIPVSLQQEDANCLQKISIKQRPHKGSQTGNGLNFRSSNHNSMKTVEERKEEYNKARARIFSNSNDAGTTTKSEAEPALSDILQKCPLVPSNSEDSLFPETSETILKRSMSSSSIGSNRYSRNRYEKEPVFGRQKTTSRVAIFRDRELDRKDPDYDRSYDRYMQRFDPGFGFNGAPYTMQPLYAPAVNYNSEFPQLGSIHRPQISIEHQPRPTSQQLRGPWPTASTSAAVNYGPPEGLMAQYNPSHVGAHPTSSIFLHSPQFSVPSRPLPFLHALEQAQYPQVDSQADDDHVESPKAIPDVNKINLKDIPSDDKDLKSNDSFLDKSSATNLPKKYVASSGFPLYGSTDKPQLDFKSNESLVEAAGTDRNSLNGLEGQKPVLRKTAVRAKVPFEKGYSPMDWMKLTRTHPDLAGLKGQTNRRLITMDEVKKHKTEGSMWTVLKGRVYNISPYMKFHPGGVDMLMKATGKDCTSLFNKYHAWVNAEFLLEKCLVGVLDNDP